MILRTKQTLNFVLGAQVVVDKGRGGGNHLTISERSLGDH